MEFAKRTVEQYEIDADKRLSTTCLVMIGLMILVGIFNYFRIFKIDSDLVYITIGISIGINLLPLFIYRVFKFHAIWVRFVLLALLTLLSGLLYVVFSYHTIMMFVFPLIVSCLFNRKSYVIYTAIWSIPTIVGSHFIAFALKIVPDEPLTTLQGVLVYGILPRLIEFLGMTLVCIFVAERTKSMLKTFSKKTNELYTDQKATITALSQIIESLVEPTGNHVRRVSEYTALLCQGMGYSEEETWRASLAAMLHDIGNINIPREILLKPDKLTPEEYDIVKQHINYGYDLLSKSKGEIMELSRIIAYEHHEHWDGSGYLHKRGHEINKFARCVALADVFDTLMNKRPYKDKFTEQAAYLEIVTDKGKHFDPRLVDVFACHYKDFIEISRKYANDDELINK